jgi:hypothetical protein
LSISAFGNCIDFKIYIKALYLYQWIIHEIGKNWPTSSINMYFHLWGFLFCAIGLSALAQAAIEDDPELNAIAVDSTTFDDMPFVTLKPVQDTSRRLRRRRDNLELRNNIRLQWQNGMNSHVQSPVKNPGASDRY